MTEIHIFRHGETEWNLEGRMQGFLDSKLTTLGRQQAREAKSKLKGLRFDVAYSSTSSRAFETVQILSEDLDLQIHKDEALREINLGVWEGMLHTDVKSKYSTEHENFWSNPSKYKGIGGENFFELTERSLHAIKQIIKKHEGQSILLVSHAAFIKTLITAVQNRPIETIWDGPFAHNLSHSILKVGQNSEYSVQQFCDVTEGF